MTASFTLASRKQTTGPDNCFICGTYIPDNSANRTREHVFPQWLLESAALRVSALGSLSQQLVPYKRLTVPCCKICNNDDFSAIERRIREAFSEGLSAVRRLARRDLFLWLGKIYYGLLYVESLRPADPRHQQGARVLSVDDLAQHQFHHLLLQAASGAITWQPEQPGPASILIYECQTGTQPTDNFDYCDEIRVPVLALRVGDIGILCVLQDGGLLESISEKRLEAAKSLRLHPTQFRELFAMVRYLALDTWRNRAHVVIAGENKETATVILAPPQGPIGGAVDMGVYASSLSEAIKTPIESIYNGTHVAIYTISDLGEPLHIPWPDTLAIGLDGLPVWPGSRTEGPATEY